MISHFDHHIKFHSEIRILIDSQILINVCSLSEQSKNVQHSELHLTELNLHLFMPQNLLSKSHHHSHMIKNTHCIMAGNQTIPIAINLIFVKKKIENQKYCEQCSQNDTPRSPMFCMVKSLFCSGKPQNHSNKNLKQKVQYGIMQ